MHGSKVPEAYRAGAGRVPAPLQSVAHQLQDVHLNETKRVARLRLHIDTDNLEAGKVVAHSRTTGPTEEIEQPRHAAHDAPPL